MVTVRSFPLMRGLILAMGMLGFSASPDQASARGKLVLHYEAHPAEASSVRKNAATGAPSVSA